MASDTRLEFFCRLSWLAVFLLCVGLAGYLTVSTLKTYSMNPVLNTYGEDEPISRFPFPATTITGTAIFINNLNTEINKLSWLAVFLLCVGLAGYLTVSTLKEYSMKPVLNTFGEDEPISRFPFPATTITGTAIFINDLNSEVDKLLVKEYDAIGKNQKSFQYKGLTWSSRLIQILFFTMDHLCELVQSFATREKILKDTKTQDLGLRDNPDYAKYLNVTLRDNMQDSGLKDTIFPFLKNKMLDCNKIVAACWWEGNKENCKHIFVPTQTDVGSGCTFNRIPDKLLRRNVGLMSVFHEYNFTAEEVKEWKQFDLDSILSFDGAGNSQTFTNPKVQHDAGKITGLSFMLIFDDEAGITCPIVDSRGYLIGIHSPFEEPRMMQTGITVPPKMEVFIKVKTEAVIADESIRSLSVERRKCYFQTENPLRNFRYYTNANCHQECLAREIQKECNCLLLTQSAGQNEVLCGPSHAKRVEEVIASIRKVGYQQFCRNPTCYSPCSELKYDADVSYLPYYKGQFFDFTLHDKLKENYVTSIVHITQSSNSVPTIFRTLQYTFSVLFGVIGGIWGVVLGFSLFTVFNIVAGIIALLIPDTFEIDEDTEDENQDQVEPVAMQSTVGADTNRGNRQNGIPSSGILPNSSVSIAENSESQGNTLPFNHLREETRLHENSASRRSLAEILLANQSSSSTSPAKLFSQRNHSKWDALMSEATEMAAMANIATTGESQSAKSRKGRKRRRRQ